jgi:hypothetical protein
MIKSMSMRWLEHVGGKKSIQSFDWKTRRPRNKSEVNIKTDVKEIE